MKVKLNDILEGMELKTEQTNPFLNLETGGVVFVSRDTLLIAEVQEDYDHLPGWQQDEVK
ncbi:hypothetical protein KO561_04745 [Radiobacillus kanasensis]|uniref:hypothetical protein n=1 Tax=Radiobacillus kanasensis TaxID=2844358 RepID=UPI001E2C35BD|nr:hypothetical protein [Radiobacillus kanasensis]UFU00265.1 hypothetical protein KO561_04745 [Radiobacillus kanasensis]